MSHTTAGKTSNTATNIKNLWRTTDAAYADALRLCGQSHFDIDVAADAHNTKCGSYIGKDMNLDALTMFWFVGAQWAWCNPPFDLKREFLAKAYEQRNHGNTCMMLPYEPTTRWWREFVHGKATVVYVPDGRYNFCHPETGKEVKGVAFASAFVVFTSLTMPTQYVPFVRGVGDTIERELKEDEK